MRCQEEPRKGYQSLSSGGNLRLSHPPQPSSSSNYKAWLVGHLPGIVSPHWVNTTRGSCQGLNIKICARSVHIFLSLYCLSGEACEAQDNLRWVLAILMEYNGLIWSYQSHIFWDHLDLRTWTCSDWAHEDCDLTRLCKQIFAKLSLFGSEANSKNRREGRCEDFSLVFALGLKDAECRIFLLSVL